MPNKPTIHYLQMLDVADLSEKPCPNSDFTITEHTDKNGQRNKSLYELIGTDFQWTDKLPWTDQQWQAYVDNDNLRTFVAYLNDQIAGYYELLTLPDSTVDINYFGLAPGFTGKGLGGFLLSHAVKTAFTTGAKKVTVNTCTHDHPAALPNYLARGFKQYKIEYKT